MADLNEVIYLLETYVVPPQADDDDIELAEEAIDELNRLRTKLKRSGGSDDIADIARRVRR